VQNGGVVCNLKAASSGALISPTWGVLGWVEKKKATSGKRKGKKRKGGGGGANRLTKGKKRREGRETNVPGIRQKETLKRGKKTSDSSSEREKTTRGRDEGKVSAVRRPLRGHDTAVRMIS